MNRKKAITRIVLGSVVIGGALTGYKWYDWHKTPDIKFLENQEDLLNALAETIIPATDTPGAAEAQTGAYIITMVKECTGRIDQNRFIDGVKDLKEYCKGNFGKEFSKCSDAEKIKTLTHFEKKGKPYGGIVGKVQKKFIGRSFFTTLKEYTVKGYCTSKPGATIGLEYLPVPGSYKGCIPLTSSQKAWATK